MKFSLLSIAAVAAALAIPCHAMSIEEFKELTRKKPVQRVNTFSNESAKSLNEKCFQSKDDEPTPASYYNDGACDALIAGVLQTVQLHGYTLNRSKERLECEERLLDAYFRNPRNILHYSLYQVGSQYLEEPPEFILLKAVTNQIDIQCSNKE